jgi:hypothetical protein
VRSTSRTTSVTFGPPAQDAAEPATATSLDTSFLSTTTSEVTSTTGSRLAAASAEPAPSGSPSVLPWIVAVSLGLIVAAGLVRLDRRWSRRR